MTTTVSQTNQTLAVSEVSKVQITDIESGPDGVVRSIKIWGTAGTEFPPVVEVVISASTSAALKVTTPELVF